ncbi:MAG: hypothetical protein HAW64_01440, partial [Alphaproteobacteria bacterium]|nr:hypothetical protein [Alphaproteobacteria bacterium]
VFVGAPLAADKKSLAVEVSLQPTKQTLTDADIEAVSEKIIAAVQNATGGLLRQ